MRKPARTGDQGHAPQPGGNRLIDPVVGLPSSLAIEMTLPLLREAERAHPSVVLRILECHSGHLAELLMGGRIDVAMLFEVEQPSLYDVQRVLTERLYLVSAPDGPVAGRQTGE